MGAKQSKRSVDISGKEGEGAGEVAAAGAGGEGRVEPLADADALKPQLNGDAHIHEPTDKEKQNENGTPETEKDTSNKDKEGKDLEDSEKEKEESPVTNGESEPKCENGDTSPTSEDCKKPKKEKVKKKWSLRSISFSRKDKPKQEKKQKDEEPKTNGEPEKVPEEVAETTPETEVNEIAEEAKPETEVKEEKTPETPVTEPITNGSSTPETPKVEIPTADEPTKESPENDRPEVKSEIEPEQLPINGLSIDEPKNELPEMEPKELSKPEETTVESPETIPATEIPVKKEVCVAQMPLIEPTPPPLPVNPPPSSVASFATTTMAPELTDASLAKTADTTIITAPPTTTTDTVTEANDTIEKNHFHIQNIPTEIVQTPLENAPSDKTTEEQLSTGIEIEEKSGTVTKNDTPNFDKSAPATEDISELHKDLDPVHETVEVTAEAPIEVSEEISKVPEDPVEIINFGNSEVKKCVKDEILTDQEILNQDLNTVESEITDEASAENVGDTSEPERDSIPSPLPSAVDEDVTTQNDAEDIVTDIPDNSEIILESPTIVINSDHIDSSSIKSNDNTEMENIKNKTKDTMENKMEDTKCNGDMEENKVITNGEASPPAVCHTDENNGEAGKVVSTPEDSMPPSLSEGNDGLPQGDCSESFPLPPSELCRSESEVSPPPTPELIADAASDTPQENLKSEIIADLIPEVPAVPELKTEMETSSDVAVAN